MIKNRVCEIKVAVEYEDVNGFSYDALAYVLIDITYEICGIRFSIIECFDETGEPIEIPLDPLVKAQLETLAGQKALEKVQPVDFEREDI